MPDELTVPAPTITSNLLANNFLEKRESPVNFTLGKVLKSDGNELLIYEVDKAVFLVFQVDQAGHETIWDKKNESWKAIGDVPENDRETYPLQYAPETPDTPWQGSVLLLGKEQKYVDTDPAVGYPGYFIRCYFEHRVSENIVHTGESVRSAVMKLPVLGAGMNVGLRIVNTGKELVAGMEFQNKMNPLWVEYFIKNGSAPYTADVNLNKSGAVMIKNTKARVSISEYGDIELSTMAVGTRVILDRNGKVTVKSSSAEINIDTNGNINLSPRVGQVNIDGDVRITGNLDVERIRNRDVQDSTYGAI